MRLVLGAGNRGRAASVAITMGAIALLAFAELRGSSLAAITPLIALVVTVAIAYRVLLAWRSLVALIMLVILFIPIKRYSLPGSLPFQLEPYRIIVGLVCLGWLTSLLIDPRVRTRRSAVGMPLAFFVAAIFLSLLANPHRVTSLSQDVVKTLIFYMSFVILYFLLVSVLRRARDIDLAATALAGGGGILAVSAVVESRLHYNVFDHLSSVMPFLQFHGSAVIDRGGRLRVVGSGQHPIAFGAALVLLTPLAVYRAQATRRRLWWVVVFLLALGALATSSRTAVTMLMTAAIVYLLMRPRQVRRMWPALLPAFIVIHFAVPGTIGTTINAFFPQGGLIAQQQNAAAGHARLSTLGPVLHSEVARDPFFGEGFGTRITVPSPTTPVPNAPITDDQWLALLAETGIAGVMAFVWLFVRFLRTMRRAARADQTARGSLLTAAAAIVTSYGVGMLTYDAYSFIQVTFIFFMVLALGAAALNVSPEEWQTTTASSAPSTGRTQRDNDHATPPLRDLRSTYAFDS